MKFGLDNEANEIKKNIEKRRRKMINEYEQEEEEVVELRT